jgi:hypothetical protein
MGHGPTVTTQNGTNTVDLVWDDNCVGRNQSVEVEITGDYGVSLASATWTYKFAPGSALPDIPDSSDVDIAKDVTVVDVSEGAFLTGPVIGLIGLILLLVIFLMIRRRPPSGDGAETKE